ncbi:hypothetical protein SAMN05421748_1611, partial [Paractinoplanes atraurantiacus]
GTARPAPRVPPPALRARRPAGPRASRAGTPRLAATPRRNPMSCTSEPAPSASWLAPASCASPRTSCLAPHAPCFEARASCLAPGVSGLASRASGRAPHGRASQPHAPHLKTTHRLPRGWLPRPACTSACRRNPPCLGPAPTQRTRQAQRSRWAQGMQRECRKQSRRRGAPDAEVRARRRARQHARTLWTDATQPSTAAPERPSSPSAAVDEAAAPAGPVGSPHAAPHRARPHPNGVIHTRSCPSEGRFPRIPQPLSTTCA